MGNFLKNKEFKNNAYKAALDQLDEETKRKLDRRRTWILVAVVAAVFCLIIVLAVTGIGTNKAESAGTILDGAETARINFLGDSVLAEATEVPEMLQKTLEEKLNHAVIVRSDAEETGKAQNTSYKQMHEACDIAILQYLYTNLKEGEDPEGILEANIDGLTNQGVRVYLLNYPYAEDAEDAAVLKKANQYISKAAKDKDVLLLDAAAKFRNLAEQEFTEAELFETDGTHLSKEGAEQLGRFVAEGLISDAGLE